MIILYVLLKLYIGNIHDKTTYDHYPKNGARLVMSHNFASNLTFCKVDVPFDDHDLHIRIPPDSLIDDVVR